MTRLRDLGVTPGQLPTGPHNAITDVPGVRVGHVTLVDGEGPLVPGKGPIRTGVTAILPHGGNLFQEKVAAAVDTINGFGKATGFEQIRELGTIETPILLTNTLNIPLAADALISYLLRENPEIGIATGTVNPVVGETNDGFLNDIQGRHVRAEHVFAAIEGASEGPVAEGNAGAGTGTTCFGFKGGIGSASRRVLDGRITVGALVQSNFGARGDLIVLGAPIGRHFLDRLLPASQPIAQPGPGSIMIVLAIDVPASVHLLGRMARRAAFGLARTGTICHDGSGDFVIAFSTTHRQPHLAARPNAIVETSLRLREDHWTADALFAGVVEAVEEAILNSLLAAKTTTGRDGHTVYALPHEEVTELLAYYHRI
jgi:D-aminopeptidase